MPEEFGICASKTVRSPRGAWSRWVCVFVLASGLAGLSSCIKKSPALISTLPGIDNSNSQFELDLYQVDGNSRDYQYVGTLQRTPTTSGNGPIEFPAVVTQYLGIPTDPTVSPSPAPTTVLYVLRAYSAASVGTDGDHYYETPVLSTEVELSGITTALWLAIKWSNTMDSAPTQLTRAVWENLLFAVESQCTDCSQKSAQDIYNLLQASPTLQALITSQLASISPSARIEPTVIQTPPFFPIYTNPQLNSGVFTTTTTAEGSTVSLQAEFYAPDKASQRLLPDQWYYQTGTTLAPGAEGATAIPAMNNTVNASWVAAVGLVGLDSVIALKTLPDGRQLEIGFPVQVGHQDLSPVLLPVSQQTFQVNHNSTFNLYPYIVDPNVQEGFPDSLIVSVTSPQIGVTFSSSAPYGLTWNPLPNQLGVNTFTLTATDSSGNTTSEKFQINVIADNAPTFASIPATLTATEAVAKSFTVKTSDADGDQLLLSCTNCATLLNVASTGGPPLLSGFFSYGITPAPTPWNTANNTLSVPGASASTLYTFTPSFLQMINTANQVLTLNFNINYDTTTNPNLRTLSPNPIATAIALTVSNADDPPTWTTPLATVSAAQSQLEGVAITPQQLVAVDPVVGSNAVTYSLAASTTSDTNGGDCSWVAVSAGGLVTGTPTVNSSRACLVTVKATLLNGLYATTQATFNIVDVPSPIILQTPIPTQTVTEGSPFTLNLASYVSDLDATDADPYNTVVYSCSGTDWTTILAQSGTNKPNLTTAGVFSWTPSYSTVPTSGSTQTYHLNFQASDQSLQSVGASPTPIPVAVVVNFAPPPMVLSLSSSTQSINEGTTASVNLNVQNLPGLTATYGYNITSSYTCTPACTASANLLTVTTAAATGSTTIPINLAPNHSDGDSPGKNFTTYNYIFNLTPISVSNAALNLSIPFALTVVNVDKITSVTTNPSPVPSATPGSPFNVQIVPTETGNAAAISYTYTATPVLNGKTLTSTSVVMNADGYWSMDLTNCPAGTSSITIAVGTTVSDGRGSTLGEDFSVAVPNVKIPSGKTALGCPF